MVVRKVVSGCLSVSLSVGRCLSEAKGVWPGGLGFGAGGSGKQQKSSDLVRSTACLTAWMPGCLGQWANASPREQGLKAVKTHRLSRASRGRWK